MSEIMSSAEAGNIGFLCTQTEFQGIVEPLIQSHEALRAKVERYEKALKDLAEHGTRHDLTPTVMFKRANFDQIIDMGPPRTGGYAGYIKEMDEYVRSFAREALEHGK